MQSTDLSQEFVALHANLASALADTPRLMLLDMLAEQPCNDSRLAQKLELPQPSISRHLKVLHESGLVQSHRQGMRDEYELTDRRVFQALDILRAVLQDHIQSRVDLIHEVNRS
jgi:ArsR family transcriptional regulator